MPSNSNRGVVYLKPGSVEVQKIDFPSFRNPAGKTIDHGVILKVVTTNICGSDQHMVRGRTTAPAGMVLGHEITGEVIEKGRDVEYLEVGDLVSVPFNVACGRCRTCREGDTGVCLHVNSDRAGGAYGYVDMGGWIGGQADYVMVPYADFNLLKFPDRAHAMEKIRDLTCLSDILPTGFHYPANGIPRRRNRQGRRRIDGLRRRSGAGRPCGRSVRTHPWRRRRIDRRYEPGAACSRQKGRL